MDPKSDPTQAGQAADAGAGAGASRSGMDRSRPVPAPSEPAAPEQTRRQSVSTDPSLDVHQKQGITGGAWIALILGAVVLVMLLIFILQNNVPADFAYLGWSFSLPLGIAMLFAALAGVLVTALFGSVRLLKLGRRVRRLEKDRETIKRTVS
ncbi:LapA family protein [Microbacterium sp. A93]|uniref:LapA family protein n=1 Tax=Microbacterium sp. A93 TaxID=3450716 RepID=UPI003F41B6E9